ncbi:hypothetical protein MJH54_33860, partial [Salmonella enterica subsp. enterica serovar Montevideo]|nr:hypothetical protein [Salmonella enterica subsp. enterica serovar Montevideo]
NGKFTLVSVQQLSMAKQQLGLSPQDSLGTRSKAIGIARNVGATAKVGAAVTLSQAITLPFATTAQAQDTPIPKDANDETVRHS